MHSIHPRAENYRDLNDAEFSALKESIAKHGQKHPIHVSNNQILDGRHRYKACRELGIEPVLEEYTGDDLDGFIDALNDARRHETPEEHEARIAAATAKVTTKRGGDGSNQHKKANGSREPFAKFTNNDAAREAGVSLSTLKRRKAKARNVKTTQRDEKLAGAAASAISSGDVAGAIDSVTTGTKGRASRDAAAAIRVAVTVAQTLAEEASVDVATLPKTYQDKIAVLERKLNREFDARVDAGVRDAIEKERERWFSELQLPEWKAAVDFHRAFKKNFNITQLRRDYAPMTSAEFSLLIKALHPDTAANHQTDAREMLKRLKDKLVCPAPLEIEIPEIPKNLTQKEFQEWVAKKMAARRAKTIEESKKAAAGK